MDRINRLVILIGMVYDCKYYYINSVIIEQSNDPSKVYATFYKTHFKVRKLTLVEC